MWNFSDAQSSGVREIWRPSQTIDVGSGRLLPGNGDLRRAEGRMKFILHVPEEAGFLLKIDIDMFLLRVNAPDAGNHEATHLLMEADFCCFIISIWSCLYFCCNDFLGDITTLGAARRGGSLEGEGVVITR